MGISKTDHTWDKQILYAYATTLLDFKNKSQNIYFYLVRAFLSDLEFKPFKPCVSAEGSNALTSPWTGLPDRAECTENRYLAHYISVVFSFLYFRWESYTSENQTQGVKRNRKAFAGNSECAQIGLNEESCLLQSSINTLALSVI